MDLPLPAAPPVALAAGWHAGDLYALLLIGVGVAVLAGAVALAHEEERAFSASIVYVGLGAAGAVTMAVLGVTPLDPLRDHRVLERLSELALVVAVFSAGLTIERHVSRRSLRSIATLLTVVMPLTVAAIAVFGMAAMGLSFGAALLLGAVLAPTDPVLAGDVGLSRVGGEVYGEPRLSLHTEAGFNDGLASPFVALGLYAAGQGGTGWIGTWVLSEVVYAAGLGLVLGALAGTGAAWLMAHARARGLLHAATDGPVAVGLMLALYGVMELVGAYGLLAVFAAGFTFRRYEYDHEINHGAHRGADGAGTVLELAVLLLLGSMLTSAGLGVPGVAGWLLAPLIILVIRPGLVLATTPRGLLDRGGKLFLGFFGVRGVAALFYAAIVAGAHVLEPREARIVVWTTLVVVVVSIVVHGLTAVPLTRRWLGPAARGDRRAP